MIIMSLLLLTFIFMSLAESIQSAFISAKKNRDQVAWNILGVIKTEIVLLSKTQEVCDEDVVKMIKAELKKLQATIDYVGISDVLKNQALAEKVVLEQFMPKLEEINPTDVANAIVSAIQSGKIEANMGSIMAFLKQEYAGKLDMAKGRDIAMSQLNK